VSLISLFFLDVYDIDTFVRVGRSVARLGKILLFGYFLLDHLLRFELNKQLGVDVLDFQFEL
jgi:hypothetical protein